MINDNNHNKWVNVFLAFETNVSGLLIKIINDQIQIYNQSHLLDFNANKDEFISTLDIILSQFYQVNNIEVKDSIFILSQDWLVANDLIPARKEILKTTKNKLGLKVNGFVVLEEALVYSIRQETLSPPSFFFVNILPENLTLTRIELGRISEHISLGRSQNLSSDISELISRLKSSVRPLKIIVAGQNKEKIIKDMSSISWQNEFGFPQIPQIDYLDYNQLGRKILKVVFKKIKKIEVVTESKLGVPAKQNHPVAGQPLSRFPAEAKTENKQPPAKAETQRPDEVVLNSGQGENLDLKTAGIILTPDEDQTKPEEAPPELKTDLDEVPSPGQKKKFTNFIKQKLKAKNKIKLSGISLKSIHLPTFHIFKINSFSISSWILKIVLLVIPFLIIPIILALAYYFLFKVNILITPRTEALNKTVMVTFATDITKPDYQGLILPARKIEFNLTKTAETTTTGTTEKGDPGKGNITIYNKTAKPQTFDQGSLLYLAGQPSKKVKLDQKVKVASQSSQTDANEITTLVPGTAEAKAETIFWGQEANLKKGTELFFSKFDKSRFKAKISQDFSGGKKYQVQSVSQDDIDKLNQEIKSQIDQDLNTLLASKLQADEKIIKSSLQTTPLENKLSSQLDQPAEKVSLKSKVKASVLVYKQQEVKKLIDQLIKTTIPDGFLVDDKNIKWNFQPSSKNQYQLNLNIPLKWNFNKKTIKENIVGRDVRSSVFYLQNLPGVFAFQISFQPPVPKILQHIPYRQNNISIKIQNK